jgi:hypothetical protein
LLVTYMVILSLKHAKRLVLPMPTANLDLQIQPLELVFMSARSTKACTVIPSIQQTPDAWAPAATTNTVTAAPNAAW